MSTFHCQYEGHEGSRLVPHPNDRWIKKTTYRRADAAVRRNETAVLAGQRCTACMEKEVRNAYYVEQTQGKML